MSTIRINFAKAIENEVLKYPELVTNLICIVADEVSNTDLINIHARFFKLKDSVYKKLNLNN